MNPIISVIVPFLNAEKFISKCIQSILNQTYTDFELILVNDGSTDKSIEVVSKFDDKRIRVLDNKVNKGVSYSRNQGIKESKGKYIVFVDADDYVSVNYLSNLLNSCQPGYLCASLFTANANLLSTQHTSKKVSFIPKKSFLNDPFAIRPQSTGMLFERGIIERQHLRFTEESSFAEDTYFTCSYLLFTKGIMQVNFYDYFYYINPNGLALNRNKPSLSGVYHRFESYKAFLSYMSIAMDICNKSYAKNSYAFVASSIMLMCYRCKEINNSICSASRDYMKHHLSFLFYPATLKHKMLFLGMLLFPKLTSKILAV